MKENYPLEFISKGCLDSTKGDKDDSLMRRTVEAQMRKDLERLEAEIKKGCRVCGKQIVDYDEEGNPKIINGGILVQFAAISEEKIPVCGDCFSGVNNE